MSIFSLFGGGANINEGVAEARETSGAILVDVREADEYASGHIKGAVNVPLSSIGKISSTVSDIAVPLFLYCASGARSARAMKALKQMGYTSVRNIGGIRGYTGPVE
ncbi:rhodanese-like domain-containing protein [Lancefieldella sp. Marseille-Q7238]|uniref:rhodanese-like domain-containing protein n=1 Tax=Lancefieldella sp. Marseille-Q7238 TaxID=3022127 RepID=UPI0024A8C862|nr:rhodanese-like domain-containing protein [Lancefieldella sp. Marseille-Q7238]